MELVQATMRDLEQLKALYQADAEQRGEAAEGLEERCREEIESGKLYIRLYNGRLAVSILIGEPEDMDYSRVNWSCGVCPGFFLNLVVHPALRNRGIAADAMDDLLQMLRSSGCDCVRCEVNAEDHEIIHRLEQSLGFRKCEKLPAGANTPERICMDKPLKRETPLLPIRMTPAFRGGASTPWGGDRLKTVYGKPIREIPTGESLEVSCIPGLESTDRMGRTLPELIAEYGRKLVGKYLDRPFPLLLKLIDARESLSVQVHPDNEYAFKHEGGKLGKTEAWLILETPENGGELVYGIQPGVTMKILQEACKPEGDVRPLLRRVQVRPGDVCYIPAGCVHAIGAGVTLYEIQESSDLTYRFYDWDRVDANGNRRELHLEKALDVTNLRVTPYPVHVEWAIGTKRVLNEEFFTLDLLRPGNELRLPPIHEFGMLTALSDGLALGWDGGRMELAKGETCFIPTAAARNLRLEGSGFAALSMPV